MLNIFKLKGGDATFPATQGSDLLRCDCMTDLMVAVHDSPVVIEREHIPHLIEILRNKGYAVIAPTLRDNAIIYDEIASVDELPAGWTDEQSGGSYRLKKRQDQALFAYTVGPRAWKHFLHPPLVSLWKAHRHNGGLEVKSENKEAPRYAFLGVRSCELNAILIQDRVFLQGDYVDPIYRLRREQVFIIAVNCTEAHGTCFCSSMGTGPQVREGFDLALTEVLESNHHYFLVEAGSEQGREILSQMECREATEEELHRGAQLLKETAAHMGRAMDTTDLYDLLQRNFENPEWEAVAQRCLTCSNCTMVCPTCFCSTVEDYTDLSGMTAERVRKWDSCFTMDFSYIHGGSVRYSSKARYRQWMTHKLSTWVDQFDVMGCVGCGRCITWCPVAIDITEEVAKIRASDGAKVVPKGGS